MKRALVVLSGGQDSTTCLAWAKHYYDDVHTITFEYGQRHALEIGAAKIVSTILGVEDEKKHLVTLGPILKGSSPLTSDNELEQYVDFHSLPGGLEKTFVPGRNALFIVIALNYAYSLEADTIVLGVCEEDFGGYPDCRLTFIKSMEAAMSLGLDKHIKIETPLMHLSKSETVILSLDLPHCYRALAYSHTSYDGNYPPIGRDHATLLREKGFVEANVPDPLILRAVMENKMELPITTNYKVKLESYIKTLQGEFDRPPKPLPFGDPNYSNDHLII